VRSTELCGSFDARVDFTAKRPKINGLGEEGVALVSKLTEMTPAADLQVVASPESFIPRFRRH